MSFGNKAKKTIALIPLILCSCNQTHSTSNETEPITSETSEKTVEPNVSMTVKEMEKDQTAIIEVDSPIYYVDTTKTLDFCFDKKLSMWDRVTNILSEKGFDITYLNSNKSSILEKQSAEVLYGLNYTREKNNGPMVTMNVDGVKNKFGYYCGVYKCLKTAKYEITYQEDNKTETFYMWLPQDNLISVVAKRYENTEEFYADLNKYYLMA